MRNIYIIFDRLFLLRKSIDFRILTVYQHPLITLRRMRAKSAFYIHYIERYVSLNTAEKSPIFVTLKFGNFCRV